MSVLSTTLEIWESNRNRTLSLLEKIAADDPSAESLIWRPGPERAHIAWQLLHIAVTEEIFASELLASSSSRLSKWRDRFCNGSVPEDRTETIEDIREVLTESRRHLLETVAAYREDDLDLVPTGLQERNWSVGRSLQILTWHEPHHHGQAHLTWNLWRQKST